MTSIEYFYNENGEYYAYEGDNYVSTFPIDWAMNHAQDTGPKDCNNCKYYGSRDNVFLGYCINCAEYVYHFERGMGFNTEFEENDPTNPNSTYLANIQLTPIVHVDGCCNLENCDRCKTSKEMDNMIEWIAKCNQEVKNTSDRLQEEWIKSGMDDLYDNFEYYG